MRSRRLRQWLVVALSEWGKGQLVAGGSGHFAPNPSTAACHRTLRSNYQRHTLQQQCVRKSDNKEQPERAGRVTE